MSEREEGGKERRVRSDGPETPGTPETPETDERLVSVWDAPDEASATLVCDFLRDQGIEATPVSVQMPWFGTIETARKGYWGHVEVLEHEADRARALIRDFFAARPEGEPGTAGDGGEQG